MTGAVMEGQPWSRRRWLWIVALFLGAQVIVIYWLGERGPAKPRTPAPVQTLRWWQNASEEWLALNDPTLFALPHRQGFSASVWLNLSTLEPRRFAWTEAPDWLTLPEAELGRLPSRAEETNGGTRIRLPPMPPSELPLPELVPLLALTEVSRLRLADQLADRPLLTPIQLADPTNSDILTNTVIQMVVDSLGRPRSFTLLASSGLSTADNEALAFARNVRFAPLPGADTEPTASSLAGLAWGSLVFDWHTLPLAPTNAVPSQ